MHKLDYGVSQPAVSYSPSLMGSCYSPLGGVAMGSQHPAPPPEPGHISPTFGTPGNQVPKIWMLFQSTKKSFVKFR